MSRSLVLILPGGAEPPDAEGLLAALRERNFAILGKKTLTLSAEDAAAFYAEHDGMPAFAPLVAAITAGPLVALALELPNASAVLEEVVALDGLPKLHVSPLADVPRELKFFFPEGQCARSSVDTAVPCGARSLAVPSRVRAHARQRAPASPPLRLRHAQSSRARPPLRSSSPTRNRRACVRTWWARSRRRALSSSRRPSRR